LGKIGHVTVLQSFRLVRLVLWDEAQRRLVSFQEIGAKNFQKAVPNLATP
jgi:omega-6 fatty acid desaturase (delta-12 desaturase)